MFSISVFSYRMRYLLLLLCFTVYQLPAQNTAAKIAAINAKVKQTDSALHTYYTKVIDNRYFDKVSDNGIEVSGFFNGRTLEKIIESVALSSCWLTYNYYLQNGKPVLITVKGTEMAYDKATGNFKYDTLQPVMAYSYYFEEYKLLHFTGTGSNRCSGKPSKTDADDLLLQCKQYVYLLKQ